MALDLVEHGGGNLGQTAVVPPGGEGVHQLGEGAVFLQILIAVVQHLLQRLGQEDPPLPLVAQPEVRVQVQQVAVLLEQRLAEGVDSGYLGPVDQGGLAAEVAVVGVLRQPVGQLLGNAAPQLRRRGLGVCNNQKTVDVQAFGGHPVQQPLHQHPGLARPRRRRHQQLAAPVVYDFSLFLCQWKGHRCRLLYPASTTRLLPSGLWAKSFTSRYFAWTAANSPGSLSLLIFSISEPQWPQ